MAVTFSDYINHIKTSTILQPRIRIQFLRRDESVESELTTDVLGGSLNINRNNGVRRSISVDLPNINGEFNPNRYGVWVNKKFKVFLGYKINREDFLLPQGVFTMTNPKYTSAVSDTRVTISGIDKFGFLDGQNGGYLNSVYIIPVGSNPNVAIDQLLTIYEDTRESLLQDTSFVTPYTITKNYGDTASSLFSELAYSLSRNIYYNEEGRLVCADDIDDDNKASLFDFNFGETSFEYLGATHEARFSDVKNVVKVIGDNVNGDIAIGLAKNTNTLSPTNINIIGEKPIPPVFQDVLQTDAQAQELAEYILKRTLALNSSVSITSIPMFHLDVDKMITLTDDNLGFNRQRFLINSITIPLNIGGTMSINAVKSDEVDIGEQGA